MTRARHIYTAHMTQKANCSMIRFSKTRNCISSRSQASGFTLIEVTVALAIFAILTIVFGASILMARASSDINGQYAQALSIGQHKIDRLRAIGYGRLNYQELIDAEIIDPDSTSSPYTFTNIDGVSNYFIQPQTQLRITPDPTDSQVMQVEIEITWLAAPGRAKRSKIVLKADIANV